MIAALLNNNREKQVPNGFAVCLGAGETIGNSITANNGPQLPHILSCGMRAALTKHVLHGASWDPGDTEARADVLQGRPLCSTLSI